MAGPRHRETEVRAALGAPANTNLSIDTILQSIPRLASGSIVMSCVSRSGSLASIACVDRVPVVEPLEFSRREASWYEQSQINLPTKGFTLYMVKAILSGKGDEVIDLARTNLWR
jgi:hypothetical protein